MRTYTVTLNTLEGDFLFWGPPYWSQKVKAINADHAARMVALDFHSRCEGQGKTILATHKSGERASVRIGEV